MRVALFSDTYEPEINGVTKTIKRITTFFKEQGIEYKIFAPRYDTQCKDENHTERFYSLKFFLYPECRLALPNLFRINKTLHEFKPDVIHLMSEFNMALVGMNYGRRKGIPVVSNYTTDYSCYTKYYNLNFLKKSIWDYMSWFHNQSSIALTPSFNAEKTLIDHGVKRTGIFSRGIDTKHYTPFNRSETLRKELGIQDTLALLYVGRVSVAKDLDTLWESYHELKRLYGDKISLVIAGDGPYLDTCKENFPKDVIFTGFKTGEELHQIYASCDIFVCPSASETFGNVILEAFASGLAVVGSDQGGVAELIEDYRNGLKFKAGSSSSLTQNLIKVIDDKGLRERIIQGATKTATERSWESVFKNLLEVYDYLISKKELEKTA